ncbi:MAG: GGDEF domain-containing protein [Planctomycetes bacterium]|nr:GGDEF domain-containing protein [Planctomycetota bacterium]
MELPRSAEEPITRDLVQRVLREDDANLEHLVREVARTHLAGVATVERLLLRVLTHLDFEVDEAQRHWSAITDHQRAISATVGRDVGLRVAMLDYFININRRVQNPKIIEIAIFEETVRSAHTDGLTGLYNRRYFDEILHREVQRCRRYGQPLSVLILDLDDFKQLNDACGHPAGDAALALVGRVLGETTRDVDVACRYGGEEFAVILPETAGSRAHRLDARVRARLAEVAAGLPRPLSYSGGIASFPEDADGPDDLLARADTALYRAKADGKGITYLYFAERRRYVRVPAEAVVRYRKLGEGRPRGRHRRSSARNLSLGGVLFQCAEAMGLGGHLELVLDFADLKDGGGPIRAVVQVRRVEEVDAGRFDVGVAFERLRERDVARIAGALKMPVE